MMYTRNGCEKMAHQLMKALSIPLDQRTLISCPRTTKMRMGQCVAAAMALRLHPSNVVTPVMRYAPAKHCVPCFPDVS